VADRRPRRLSARLSGVGRAHPVGGSGGRQAARRMVGVDSVRRHDDRRDVAPRGHARAATARTEPNSTLNRPIHSGSPRAATALAGLLLVATMIAVYAAPAFAHHVGAARADARAAIGRKFLEAIWRYYNLVDFLVTQRNARAATTVRLAFDEAEGYVKAAPPAPERLGEPLRRIVHALTGVIETSS